MTRLDKKIPKIIMRLDAAESALLEFIKIVPCETPHNDHRWDLIEKIKSMSDALKDATWWRV